ncbi:Ankyrin Repeat [Seminavis robusta]|uniref:Ankyrin Repeat n=1 Tax=Seminavis robusta TaxID=568900 RepID=A0A9N8DE85_9STRA|nr:Ankyrin Repeat [Seminavis robusta]|eukprot:Sro53_g031410.1 Ankyrin Repeat (611) ;mRNA; f:75144-76976
MPSTSCLCGSYGAGKNGGELMDEATVLPVCDYDENPTPLYKALEYHHWGAASRFLKTGVWPGNFFSDRMTPREQVRTWIHRYDESGHELLDDSTYPLSAVGGDKAIQDNKSVAATTVLTHATGTRQLRWRQLPLHAALIFMAPPLIIKQLIEAFPYALRCPDDKGMLPVHLAFRQGVPDDVLTILLRLFPNGMHVRDQKGRLPVECVRNDDTINSTGMPPLRGMIIQSIMQQSKEKFSQQQQETIQTFQKDIGDLHEKLKALESHMQEMNQRETKTREELSSTLAQLESLKKNHRKLQELQRYSLQRASEQEEMDKQTQSFQQRVMEQLDFQHHKQRRSSSRGKSHDDQSRRSRSRGRTGTRRDQLDPPREQAPPSPGHLLRDDSRANSQYTSSGGVGVQGAVRSLSAARRAPPSQSSFEDESPSYSSGLSEFTKSVIPNAYTGYTTGTNTVHEPARIFQNPSYVTKATAASGTTFHTQAQLSRMKSRHDDERSRHHSPSRTTALHPHQSIFEKRRQPKGIARSIYPIRTNYESSTDNLDPRETLGVAKAMVPSNKNQKGQGQGQANSKKNDFDNMTSIANCGATESPGSLNWDFSFTPGFLQPLSINEL